MEKLAPLGVEVSEASGIHPAVSGEVGQGEIEPEPDMMGGVKSDFVSVHTYQKDMTLIFAENYC